MFGGYGILTDSIQPGAMFTKSTTFPGGKGWSNELNVFNTKVLIAANILHPNVLNMYVGVAR